MRKMKSRNAPRRESKEQPGESRNSVIFGVLPVLEALRAENRKIEKVLILEGAREHRLSEIVSLAKVRGIPFQKMSRDVFSGIVGEGVNHQAVAAISASADYENFETLFESILGRSDSLSLILDGVEDPRNFGALLRVAECAAVQGVFIPERRAVGLTETVAKSSAGALEYIKVSKVTNVNRLIDELKQNNIWVIGASGAGEMDYYEWDWTQRCALVMGGEGKGLHRLTAEKCDVLVRIPMLGNIESLNVSVAAGVILFEAVRQRLQKTGNLKDQTSN